MAASLTLSTSARRALDRLAADARRVLGDRLVAVIATSTSSSVIFADTIRAADLEALGALVGTWHHDGLETPLLLTADEFRRSLDTFPIEYQTMIDRHVQITGTPPFTGISVAEDGLRRACEILAKGHLIHLRQGWLEAEGHDEHLKALIANSAEPLRALLSNVARLSGARHGGASDLPSEGARLANLPEDLIRAVLSLEDTPELAPALVPRMAEYVAAAEQLWMFIDRWPTVR